MKKIYILDPKIKWKTFKLVHDKIVKDSGPTPMQLTKIIWRMLRDKEIMCWFASDMKDDLGLGFFIPKRYKNYQVNTIK